jgi:beta-1,4-mannosyl-glycoprotein beta-1,4-N-acetylglucosaminyltransferase
VVDRQPPDLLEIYDSDKDKNDRMGQKQVLNGYKRDNYQRQMAAGSLENIEPEDWIIINDIDEIPNLENINLKEIKNKIIIFKQQMFYYKFNLLYPEISWHGSKACKKRDFISPQWLRDLKHKKYPLWRLDMLFSKKKYNNIFRINNGGWHFTNIKSPEDIKKKLMNYAHHYEFEQSGLNIDDLKQKLSEKKIIYDHGVDQRESKWKSKKTLTKIDLKNMPTYLRENYAKYSNWLE